MEVDLDLLKKMSAEYAESKNVAIKGIYSFPILYHKALGNGNIFCWYPTSTKDMATVVLIKLGQSLPYKSIL